MKYEYSVVSPSLSGVLSHESLTYEGLKRPSELMRVCDGPARRSRTAEEEKLLLSYFNDLYAVFMKKLSVFVLESDTEPDDTVKLQAMLQEMVKVKRLLGVGK